MNLQIKRAFYILGWVIAIPIIIPVSAIVFPILLLLKIPSMFVKDWPRKYAFKSKPFIPTCDNIFGLN